MKPKNSKKLGCTPSASDCIVWTGPNIDCINLCKGDSISDVTYKLALELCTIMDQLNISNYDLSCFNLTQCGPEDIKGLIQLLIDKVCEALNLNPQTIAETSGCPDCVVNIASCFYYKNELGDQMTTMQLSDYVAAIGNKICTNTTTVGGIQEAVGSVSNRVTALENAPALENPIPKIETVDILSGGGPVDVHLVVQELESQFAEYKNALGPVNNLLLAVSRQSDLLQTEEQLSGPGNMSDMEGWVTSPKTVADTLNNLWLTMLDARAAIRNIQLTYIPTFCSGVIVGIQGTFISSTSIKITFTGNIPTGTLDCNLAGTLFTISDEVGNQITEYIQVANNLNNSVGHTIDLSTTGLNYNSNISVKGTACFKNSAETESCERYLAVLINNTNNIPALSYSPTTTTIPYNFNYLTAASFEIYLKDSTGSVVLQTNVHNLTGVGTVAGVFSGLNPNTIYKIEVKVIIGTVETSSPDQIVTTLDDPCIPPSNVIANIL